MFDRSTQSTLSSIDILSPEKKNESLLYVTKL